MYVHSMHKPTKDNCISAFAAHINHIRPPKFNVSACFKEKLHDGGVASV
jgi:hypothetical protein